tara:strand:- start:1471 stop:1968 length:498 start_codon:yes stop_codon:yes gene_type:complete
MDEQYNKHIENTSLPPSFSVLDHENFDPKVWGPHYWFFLHTIAHNYPFHPNKVTIRKYYDLIQNMPLFIPNEKIGNDFSKLLDRFPVTPYLDNRDSFIRWMHFIHNRINRILDKEELTLFEALENYREKYKPPPIKISEKMNIKKEYIIAFFTALCLVLIIYFYQ